MMGMVRGTQPLTTESKEVEDWRGQEVWPGKSLKKSNKEGGVGLAVPDELNLMG